MALKSIVQNQPDTPYYRPPPIHIFVLDMKEQPRIILWDFGENEQDPKPQKIKKNKQTVITDGQTLHKLTLFEEFATKIQPRQGYFMRGYSLRGSEPPFVINIGKETTFFKSAALEVSDEQFRLPEKLLSPESKNPNPPEGCHAGHETCHH